MLTADFDYELPGELIAQGPLGQRDQSRLLILDRSSGAISHSTFSRLPEYLAVGDCLVLNDSRVIPAKFRAFRLSGGKIEGLFLAESDGVWQVMLRPSARLQENEALELAGYPGSLRLLKSLGRGIWKVRPEPPASSLEILESIGRAPLPPYIKRQTNTDEPTDKQWYQTIFASEPGSVAAPTAGLHFTKRTFRRLKDKGIQHTYITLHVGLGTFAPLVTEHIEGHQMHQEWFSISENTAKQLRATRASGGKIVAVGSTSVRVLEAVSCNQELTVQRGWTDIFIRPGYEFRATDMMLTNFHLPRSTLLVLVCAFASRELIFEAYQQAIARGYRFYSYGDAMLIV
ncbi:MAG: tRNA preQ1(34) S-adenosylmethionine ribosyltransferase-isomerase QueA [Actinobacteria bacterium]|nr:tRNA preQ1(34) S-adenosylmethionine ribosyltransferase-isomerase QueA [Actinomycetota bacterium]